MNTVFHGIVDVREHRELEPRASALFCRIVPLRLTESLRGMRIAGRYSGTKRTDHQLFASGGEASYHNPSARISPVLVAPSN